MSVPVNDNFLMMVYSIENKLDQKFEVLDSNLGAKDKMNTVYQIINELGRHYFPIY